MPTREDQRFCRDRDPANASLCRQEWNRYGSSYGPLKDGLHKAIEKKYAELRADTKLAVRQLASQIDVLSSDINLTAKALTQQIEKMAVEVAELRKQLDEVRGQLEELRRHTHRVYEYTEAGAGVLSTSRPEY
jgi:archaellum component FlaC